MREVFLKIYGIPIASWNLAVGGAEPLPPPTQRVKEPSVAASVPANTALPTNLQLAEMQVRQYLDLAQNPALSPDTRLKVMSSLDGAIQKRAKLQGELDEMTESRMIKTPPFQRIAGVWMDWAHKWPEAARELGLAMQKFDTEGRPPPLEE
jgi:hypothetical protein